MTDPIDVTCQLSMVADRETFYGHIRSNAKYAKGPEDVVQPQSHRGKSVAICGAGPSLAENAHYLPQMGYDEIWGCNRALPWLIDHDYPVTHGFAVDQGIDMLKPTEWRRTFPVTYYVASSIHPLLAKHLKHPLRRRRLVWFHNFLGVASPEGWEPPAEWKKFHPPPQPQGKEFWLYTTLWPSTVQVGYGLNAVPRAVCMAFWMGFSTIDVYGADCACLPDGPPMPLMSTPEYEAWTHEVMLYPEHSVYETYGKDAVMVETVLGPHRWHLRPDLLISARHLAELARAFDGQPHEVPANIQGEVRQVPLPNPLLTLVGDTFPNWLTKLPEAEFAKLPNLNGMGGISGFQLDPRIEVVVENP